MVDLKTIFNKSKIGDRQINELIGISKGLLADGKITQDETETLQKWLVANEAASSNPIINNLLIRINSILEDGIVDENEAKELFETLSNLTGGEYELGELLKSTTLPLTKPFPDIEFTSNSFCFTGTFAFGRRNECEQAILDRDGMISPINRNLDYLVIGIYATDSWAHSSWGRKIEKALELNNKESKIKIISEIQWVEKLNEN